MWMIVNVRKIVDAMRFVYRWYYDPFKISSIGFFLEEYSRIKLMIESNFFKNFIHDLRIMRNIFKEWKLHESSLDIVFC